MAWRCCILHLIKQNKLFAENFSENSNLDDSLPIFSSRINLKQHNISVTPKMIKKVIMNLEMSKGSGPDCYYHVTYKFQSESTLCSCLNVKELLS